MRINTVRANLPNPDATGTSARGAAPCLRAPWFFFAVLAAMFAAHIVLRVFMLAIPELDESWQLVLSQHWALGYYAHPPLYTWLQIVFFKVFGESIFTLSLLKNVLLFGLYVFTYAAAKLLTRRHDYAAFAAICLLLIPQIAWESQRDLTHSVLLSTTTAATLWAFFRIAEKATTGRYAVLGICIGSTLLAKYNSGIFLLAGIFSALMVPVYRRLLLDRRMLVSAAIALAVAVPHLLWIAQHFQVAFASTAKLDFRPAAGWGSTARHLPGKLANAFLPNLIPLAVVYLLAEIPSLSRWRRPHFRTDAARLLFWGSVFSFVLLSAGMFASKASSLRGRWFQPVFVCAPVLLVAQVKSIPRWLYRFAATVAAGAAIAVFILLPVNVSRGGGSKSQDVTAATIADATAHAGEELRQADLIIADDFWVGGAMRLAFHKPVVTMHTPENRPPTANHPVAVFQCRHADAPAKEFGEFVDRVLGSHRALRVIHLTPGDNPEKTGVRLGVAVIE